MSKKEQLESIIEHYANGNKAKMARLLGISPQSISTWLSRNTFDYELIYSNCVGISPEWLLSGKGKMVFEDKTHDKPYIIPDGPDKSLIVAEQSPSYTDYGVYERLYKEKDEENKKLIEEVGKLKEQVRSLKSQRSEEQSHEMDVPDAGCAAVG